MGPAAIPALMWASVAISAAGAGLTAMQQIGTGRAQKQLAERNAAIAERAAEDRRARGEQEATAVRMKTSDLIAKQRAAIGASGVVADEGMSLYAIEDAAAFGELDALIVQNNAGRDAWGLEVQGQGHKFSGDVASANAAFSAGSTILTGAASSLSIAGSIPK